jgi:molybdopterin synthase sulfur carrier subunit
MKVTIPSPLYVYTGGARELEADGATLEELVNHLDARYPGLRFRIVDEQGAIRPHIRFFVNAEGAPSLSRPLAPRDEVLIVAALSGG